jgi:hypothetical protein
MIKLNEARKIVGVQRSIGTVEDHEPPGITGDNLSQDPRGCRYLLIPALSAIKPSRICCLMLSSCSAGTPSCAASE